MQSVSQAWKDVQEQYLVPESYIEITMNVGDPDAQSSATSSDNGHVDYSDSSSLVEAEGNDPALYATLEHNIWALNGTFEILPDKDPYGKNGGRAFEDVSAPSVLFCDDRHISGSAGSGAPEHCRTAADCRVCRACRRRQSFSLHADDRHDAGVFL